MSTMTAAQLAQQHNRASNGRYAEQHRAESDLDLDGTAARDAEMNEWARRLGNARQAAADAECAKQRMAGQLLLRQLRAHDPRIHAVTVGTLYGDPHLEAFLDAQGEVLEDADIDEDDFGYTLMMDAAGPDHVLDAGYRPAEDALPVRGEDGSLSGIYPLMILEDGAPLTEGFYATAADRDKALIAAAESLRVQLDDPDWPDPVGDLDEAIDFLVNDGDGYDVIRGGH